MKRILIGLLAAGALSGCTSLATAAQQSPAGQWKDADRPVVFTLTQFGTSWNVQPSKTDDPAMTGSGTFDGANFSATLSKDDGKTVKSSFTYSGKLTGSAITGTLEIHTLSYSTYQVNDATVSFVAQKAS